MINSIRKILNDAFGRDIELDEDCAFELTKSDISKLEENPELSYLIFEAIFEALTNNEEIVKTTNDEQVESENELPGFSEFKPAVPHNYSSMFNIDLTHIENIKKNINLGNPMETPYHPREISLIHESISNFLAPFPLAKINTPEPEELNIGKAIENKSNPLGSES